MLRRPTLLRILLTLLPLLASASPALALPTVFYSAADDGVDSGIAEIVADGGETALSLWLDPDGSDFYEYLVSFSADSGLALLSFEPEPLDGATSDVVLAAGDGGTLALISGSAFEPHSGPIRIGTLVVSGLSAGAELRLDALAGVAPPALVDDGFALVGFETPDTVARVVSPIPEPDARVLLLVGGAVVACAITRVARA